MPYGTKRDAVRKGDQRRDHDQALRDHLSELLEGRSAHVNLAAALKGFPADLYGVRPPNAPHSGWELLEHIRLALDDLLDFSTNPNYQEANWPEDYWPKSPHPPSAEAWRKSVRAVEKDLAEFEALVRNPSSDLYAEIPWAKAHQTLLREVMLAADHTSYHTGELVQLRRLLGAWKS